MIPLLLAGAAGLILLRLGRRRRGWRLALLSLAGIFALSWPPVAWLLTQPLERPFPPSLYPEGEAGAIVVLSGGMSRRTAVLPEEIPSYETYERCARAAWLYRHWRPLPVLASGGRAQPGTEPMGSLMRRVMSGMGVPPEAIWTEDQSASTRENAVLAARILREKGIRRVVVVTNAYHMLRAARCFEKVGLEVVPAPCGYSQFTADVNRWLPGWRAILWHERIFHEALGLAHYRLRGWI